MQITWYGHSCFLLETDAGTRILTDPCDPSVGYTIHGVACDIVTMSHAHHDHCYIKAVSGAPEIVNAEGAHSVCGITITGYPSWHDEVQGGKRGANLLFLLEADGLRLLHLGDLGHALTPAAIDALGRVDVLFCPVGGVYTIDALKAVQVVNALDPAICIPMHYQTPSCTLGIGTVDPFMEAIGAARPVHRVLSSTCAVSKDALSEKRVLLLDYIK